MNKKILLTVAAFFLTVPLSASAAFIDNGFGLDSPASTITFDEVALTQGTPIFGQYADFGFFSAFGGTLEGGFLFGFLGAEAVFSEASVESESVGINGNHISIPSIDGVDAVGLNFTGTQSSVAFGFDSLQTGATVSAFLFEEILLGDISLFAPVLVESFTTTVGLQSIDSGFLGFRDILFDTIIISGLTGSSSRIDNIQFGDQQISPVPVPAAAWLFGSGLMLLFGLRRRAGLTKAA